jgi:hypothetical protein
MTLTEPETALPGDCEDDPLAVAVYEPERSAALGTPLFDLLPTPLLGIITAPGPGAGFDAVVGSDAPGVTFFVSSQPTKSKAVKEKNLIYASR